MSRRPEAVDWMFRNRETGKVTIGQPANLEQKIFQFSTVVGTLLPKSPVRTGAGVVAVLSLAVWGIDELARGVNPFRRMAGAIALGSIVYLALRRK